MAELELLIEPETLVAELGNDALLIIDVCSADSYKTHHIPGAVHIPPAELQAGTKPAVGKIPEKKRLDALFSAAGLNSRKHVVVYDDEGGGWAGRLIWTLDVLGHRNYSYVNGGLHAWLAAGLPVTTELPTTAPSEFVGEWHEEFIAEAVDVLDAIDDDDQAIWDARSPEEYRGEKVVAQRGGHIPGAINIDWLELMDRERQLRLVDLQGLQQRLDKLGLSKDKTVITHCQTHHRSGLSYMAMKILGYDRIKGYHGSWSEWGNREDTPINTGANP
ncbi:sulfurtransferase [Litorivivens sp.]|uniref:sulfurtransferase n=1 Tax=Litorivivens sp. TaxID=2020868 RepID=UPI003564910C